MSTAERIRAILVKDYKLNPEQITPDAALSDLGVDSLGIAELMFNIEDEFGLVLELDSTQITSFGDVVQLIDGLIAAKSASSAISEHSGFTPAQASMSIISGAPIAP